MPRGAPCRPRAEPHFVSWQYWLTSSTVSNSKSYSRGFKGLWGTVSDGQKSRTQRREQGEYCKRNCYSSWLFEEPSSNYIAQARLEFVIIWLSFHGARIIGLHYTWLKLYFYNKISDHLVKSYCYSDRQTNNRTSTVPLTEGSPGQDKP